MLFVLVGLLFVGLFVFWGNEQSLFIYFLNYSFDTIITFIPLKNFQIVDVHYVLRRGYPFNSSFNILFMNTSSTGDSLTNNTTITIIIIIIIIIMTLFQSNAKNICRHFNI